MFVTLLGAILAAMAIPSIQDNLSYYRLSASGSEVAAELNAARILAISRGATYTVQLDMQNGTLQVVDLSDPSNPPRSQKSLHQGVTFRTVPQPDITFYSRGHARAGTIEVQGQTGHIVAIDVLASGRIKVQEMTGS